MRLIPRSVWVDMVSHAQRHDETIRFVLDEMYWAFDLEQLIAKSQSEGRAAHIPDLLQELMGEMGDSDWWKLNSAFEEHIMRTFSKDPSFWSGFVDPVYDVQEREGWRERQ